MIYPTLDRDLARDDIISNLYYTFRWHATFPIEGAGGVHVWTTATIGDAKYAYSDVTLVRYRHGRPVEHVPVTGSVCEKMVARCMHEHCCDVERLTRCVRGGVKALYIGDIDWEIDDGGTEPIDGETEDLEDLDPGGASRVEAIIARAQDRPVRAPEVRTTSQSLKLG